MEQFSIDKDGKSSEKINSEKDNNIELIKNIKIELGEWTNEENIGSKWESPDGGLRDDRKKIRVRNAGFEVEIGNTTIYIDNEDEDEAIKKISDSLDTSFSQEEILELKAKFPKFTIVDNPFMVEEKKWEGYRMTYEEGLFNNDVYEKLQGLKTGKAILKNDNIRKDIYGPGNFFVGSEIKKIISREDAERRGIPGKPYEGSLLVNYPEKIEEFNKVKSIKIEKVDDELYGNRTFQAEVSLESNKSSQYLIDYNDVRYKIKNVPIKIREYEEIKNLDSGIVEEKFIGEKEVFEDRYINASIPSNQSPIPDGEYTIEYIIPTSGKSRGVGSYHIITEEIINTRKEAQKKEEEDPYQVELAKTATKMNNLISSHNTQENLLMYAVKGKDGLWHPYVGEPYHLVPLKGYKSSMSAESSEELIKMYEDAGYRKITNDE